MPRLQPWLMFALTFVLGIGIGFALGQFRSRSSPIVKLATVDHFPAGSVTALELPTSFCDPMRPLRGPASPNQIDLVSPVRVFIVHDTSGEFFAFYDRDTHSACHVMWQDDKQRFFDPCHGSKYTRTGEYLEGPAPRGLDRFRVVITDDGMLSVDVNGFQMGAPHG